MLNATTLALQAAAEYVGTMLSGLAVTIGNGFDAVGRFVQRNPTGIIIAAIALVTLLGMARRRR